MNKIFLSFINCVTKQISGWKPNGPPFLIKDIKSKEEVCGSLVLYPQAPPTHIAHTHTKHKHNSLIMLNLVKTALSTSQTKRSLRLLQDLVKYFRPPKKILKPIKNQPKKLLFKKKLSQSAHVQTVI